MMRYFESTGEVYEQVRAQLDAAWGHPNAEAQTCFQPVSDAPRSASGLPMLAVHSSFCEIAAVASVLPGLLASGAVAEIDGLIFQRAIASL